MTDQINVREIVYDMLLAVEKEKIPSHIISTQTLTKYQYLDKKERAFISRLFRGVLEYQILLDKVIIQFSSVKWQKIKLPVRCMLRMGVYQLLFMTHVPDAAICNEMVKLSKKRGFKNLSGYINGILRNVARNKEQIHYPDKENESADYLSMKYALPKWIIELWLQSYDFATIEQIAKAFLDEQKTTVRIRHESDREKVLSLLQAQNVQVEEGSFVTNALRISSYDYLTGLDAFNQGYLAVQDESAMLAAIAANVKSGNNIIDVCAAPGGKSLHMADIMMDQGHVDARDLTSSKVEHIQENVNRLGLHCVNAMVADASILRSQDIEAADCVMADLPCSGLGVIGRKPDIKNNISEQQIHELSSLQRKILNVVWQYVKPQGVLIYSTCTVSKEENEDNMKWFEQNYPFELESLDPYIPEILRNETTKQGWIQILPGQYQSDGFFIARFRRKGDENTHGEN